MKKHKIAIIGTGSAGVLALSHFLTYLPKDWDVYSIYDPNTPRVGIGESTNPSFVASLDTSVGFHILRDLKELEGTIKYATVFKNWRKEHFYHPLLGGSCAIHFNTHKLFDFIKGRFEKEYPDNFKQIHGYVEDLKNEGDHVSCNIDGKKHTFNFVIQCTGFPKDYTDYQVCNLPVNHALVHNIQKPGDWEYTGHRATRNGWMFEIPLTTRQSYGYLYNDNITTKEEAKKDFSKEIMVPESLLDNIEYKFKSYYTKELFDGRICKQGNNAIFFEPISATSLWLYDNINRLMFDYMSGTTLSGSDDIEPTIPNVNKQFLDIANQVEELICYYYHGGSIYDTPFWKHTIEITNHRLKISENLQRMKESFSREHLIGTPVNAGQWCFTAPGLLKIDKNFGYNYFTKKD